VGFLSVDVASELLPMDVGPPAMRFTPAGDRRRWRMLIRRLGTDDPLDRQEALVDLMFAAIPQPLRGLPDPVTGVERQVARVRELLHATLDEDLSLDRLAAHLGANKFVLVRSFRKLTGTTPYQYRTLLRVERARELLALGVSPGEAAAIAGFADQPHMTRSFKRVFGLTPSAYVRGPRGRVKATTAGR
jgi:AraC-like DNA-binding protein